VLRPSLCALALTWPLAAQVSVLTYQYDNTRAGANLSETVLTTSNVNSTQFGKLFSYAVDGAVYGQPLYLPNVSIPKKGVHNTVYVVTEHDSVYAFDADTNAGTNSAPLWQVSFLNAGAGATTVPYEDAFGCGQITPEIGITSTPVIDSGSGTIYVVAMTKEMSGGAASYVHRLHALDVTSGAERQGSPVVIQASVPGTGEGGSTIVFSARSYKQRPGLLLLNGVVYTAWSSHCDAGTYHGWLIGYDEHSLQQVSVFNNTPNGNEASFWAGGAAPAADANGNIYLVGGNGSFDYASKGPDLGESYIKLSTAGGLAVADWFTPFNYADLNSKDADVGSAGVALLPDEAGSTQHPHLMVGAGKEGRIYLLDRDNLGKLQSGSDSQIVQSMAGLIGGLFGNPAYYHGTIYFCGNSDALKAFPISGAQMAAHPSSQTTSGLSFPGCVPSISANGTSNGIVWILEAAGVLHAFDALNLGHELYDSNQNKSRDALGSYVKFTVPTIVNGKVYAATQSSLAVYGVLAQVGTIAAANAASGDASALAPGSIASIYGSGFSQSVGTATSFPVQTNLAGVSVNINGVPAPIFYAGPTQINVQVPFEVPTGSANLNVSVAGAPAGSQTFTVKSTAPGLFLLAQGRAAAVNQDGSINSQSQPAPAGSVIAAFVTGLGAAAPPVPTGSSTPLSPYSYVTAPVTATLGGQPATVLFAGLAPGFAGLYQVNVVVPQLAAGNYPLQISAGGVNSNTATVSVK
jgi:uncharacterized protein (TIGR03437 family)